MKPGRNLTSSQLIDEIQRRTGVRYSRMAVCRWISIGELSAWRAPGTRARWNIPAAEATRFINAMGAP